MTEVTYFERLDVPECLRLLRGGGVGRVVWQDDDGLSVLLVNYRVIDDSVVFQTSAGILTLRRQISARKKAWKNFSKNKVNSAFTISTRDF